MPYDIFKDLVTVSFVSSSPEVLVVAPQLGVKTYAELVAYGKANPGKLNFASAGVGTTPHLAGEMWMLRTGIKAVHVPYKGIGASYTDMMSNKVQMAFSSIRRCDAVHQSKGDVIPLATTGTKRSAGLSRSANGCGGGPARIRRRSLARRLRTGGNTAGCAAEAQCRNQQGAAGQRPQSFLRKIWPRAARHQPCRTAPRSPRSEYEKWKKVITDGHITLN